ncbi:MAG: TIGR02186 family protein [Bdellovibrionales bacterium]
MTRFFLFFIAVFAFLNIADVHARSLTIDLAQDHVDITTGFDGSYLTLFGVKEEKGDVAVVMKGPKKDVVVRQKASLFGVWMNRHFLVYGDVPSFYDFALSDKAENLLEPPLLKEYGIGLGSLKFAPDSNDYKEAEINAFNKALVRNKQAEKLFPVVAKDIVFISDNFFKTEFYLPSNVPTGTYTVETFLINNGRLVEKRETQVKVAQVGFNSGVNKFAHSFSLAYGFVIVLIAVIAGWLSNAVRQTRK